MQRILRVVAVTAGLMAAGAVGGAICGTLLLLVPWVLTDGLAWLHDAGVLLVSAAFGAYVGAVAAPVLAWGLLRHVPLGRAITHTALGTLLGGGLGWLVARNPVLPGLAAVIAGGVSGFVLAGVRLRLTTSRAARLQRAGEAA